MHNAGTRLKPAYYPGRADAAPAVAVANPQAPRSRRHSQQSAQPPAPAASPSPGASGLRVLQLDGELRTLQIATLQSLERLLDPSISHVLAGIRAHLQEAA